jgi:hypothetical protein
VFAENAVAAETPASSEAGLVGEGIDAILLFADRVSPADDCPTDGTRTTSLRGGVEAVSSETAGCDGERAGEPDETSGADDSNRDQREENVFFSQTIPNDNKETMNIARTERPRGHGPLTVLGGVTTTALAVVFDAAENEPLHVTVEEDDLPESEEREVSDR